MDAQWGKEQKQLAVTLVKLYYNVNGHRMELQGIL